MGTYNYKIRSIEGKVIRGKVEANALNEAILKVQKLGGLTLEVEEGKSMSKAMKVSNKGMKLKDRIIFTEQLAVMLNAGVTLIQALKGLEEESQNKVLISTLHQVIADVEAGNPFSTALTHHPKVFSTIYCEMVK